MRLFIGIDLPEHIKDELVTLQQTFVLLDLFSGRLIPRENLHITVLFLGTVEPEKLDQLSYQLANLTFDSFTLTLGAVEIPHWSHPHVMWVRTHSEAFVTLANVLQETLGITQDRAPFGHCTIARISTIYNKIALKEALQQIVMEPLSWQVSHFVLYQSHTLEQGAKHVPLETFSFKKKAHF